MLQSRAIFSRHAKKLTGFNPIRVSGKVGQIIGLLSREFLVLVGLAALIAWPIAFLAMNLWLRGFAYKTGLHPWVFIGSAFAALSIAFLTVSGQAFRASTAKPVDSLKYE